MAEVESERWRREGRLGPAGRRGGGECGGVGNAGQRLVLRLWVCLRLCLCLFAFLLRFWTLQLWRRGKSLGKRKEENKKVCLRLFFFSLSSAQGRGAVSLGICK